MMQRCVSCVRIQTLQAWPRRERRARPSAQPERGNRENLSNLLVAWRDKGPNVMKGRPLPASTRGAAMRRLPGHSSFLPFRCFAVAAMLVAVTAGSALAQGTHALHGKGINADKLLAKAASPNGVRVIVTLSGATVGAQSLSLPSASAAGDAAPATAGLLRDGQSATAEQAQVIVTHVNGDESKRQRWAPRLI